MGRNILASGAVILVIGFLLVFAFWPLTGISGEELSKKQNDGGYEGYQEGDNEKVYGTITDLGGTDGWGDVLVGEDFVIVTLDGDFTFTVIGTSEIPFSEGDSIYVTLTLNEDSFFGPYWMTDSEEAVNSKTTMDYIFYGVTGLGIAVSAAGIAKD